MPAPIPADDDERVAALRRYEILDTAPEAAFDRITSLLALLLDVPTALVNLIDADRQFVKSQVGTGCHDVPRDLAFCGHTILSDECLVVEDARADARFAEHPAVGTEPGLRFYAGAPLLSQDGYRIGSLCAVDQTPRRLSPRELRILMILAQVTSDQLELHRTGLQLHKELRARARIQRRKDELVATVSHELRTPLTAITGSLALVASGVAGTLPVQAGQLVEVAHRGSLRLSGIVNDILEVERLGAADAEFKREPILLASLAGQAIESFSSYAQQAGVGLRLSPASDHAVRAAGDPGRILQVLDNLLSNAIKYSPAGATVDVAVEHGPAEVTVSVRDRGRGIPVEFQHRIFERFAMADGPRRGSASSGLGLSIARAMIEGQGGRIGFASPLPDGGTLFWFALPRVESSL